MTSNQTCKRGDDWERILTFKAGVDLTLCKLWLTIKTEANKDALDANAIIQIKSFGDSPQIEILDALRAKFLLLKTQTATFPLGTHYYDVQIEEPSGRVTSPEEGRFAVTRDITRATTAT